MRAVKECVLAVPAYNEARRIERCLDAAAASPLPEGWRWRGWVVLDDDSGDGTAELARAWAGRHRAVPVRVRQGGGRAGKAARLQGLHAELVAGDGAGLVVVVADADAPVDPGALRALLEPFDGPERPAVVWGNDRISGAGPGRWASAFQLALTEALGRRLGEGVPRAYGRLFAYRVAALADFGWRPGQVDDVQLAAFAASAELAVASAWQATVAVTPAGSWADFYRQTYRSYWAEAQGESAPGESATGVQGAGAARVGALVEVTGRHPAWAAAYLAARAYCAARHHSPWRLGFGPVWSPAASTKG